MPHTHTVIDIFAGPGGLSEGFSGLTLPDGHRPFRIGLSAEMEASAHATLSLRALYRQCMSADARARRAYWNLVSILADNPKADLDRVTEVAGLDGLWREVQQESLQLTLGEPEGNARLRYRLRHLNRDRGALVLIGGPPCQAYSLVGRARNRGIQGYRPEKDKRHFLYEQYLSILREFKPDVFIMENVKGILSSKVSGTHMFDRILEDLQRPSGNGGPTYELIPLAVERDTPDSGNLWPAASDFIVRSESFGIPQARHRVIILGARRGSLAARAAGMERLVPAGEQVNLEDVLSDLPRLRSGLSRSDDSGEAWQRVMKTQQASLVRILRGSDPELADYVSRRRFSRRLPRESRRYLFLARGSLALHRHFRNPRLKQVLGHETRGHMPEDLCRYLFCAAHTAVHGQSPTSSAFPDALRPAHRSWDAGHFADRFRVQRGDTPASTVTSHLAKDGHHFIHWDPQQCRSLTVREAARIQTFPDDYLFLGNRTQQYTQVGNAVPPLLARQIAAVAARILG